MIDEKQIEQNWKELIIFIEDNFDGERQEKLLEFYDTFSDRIATAPASGQVSFHSCFVGGYVHHVLNMLKCTKKVSDLWLGVGGKETYTLEELNFASLNHDLGKVGNVEFENYVPVEDNWKVKRGNMFEVHAKLPYMAVQDRSIFLLQQHGIKITETEYLGIKLHDGLYDDGNKSYFMSYDVHYHLRTMLPHVMHWGDMIATKLEYEQWVNSPAGIRYMNRGGVQPEVSVPKKKPTPKFILEEDTKTDISSFEDLFGDALKMKEK